MKEKFKICFVIDSLTIGGVSKLTLDLISKFDCNIYDITLITFGLNPEGNLDIPSNLKVVNFKIKEYGFVKRLIIFNRLLKGYDLIHSSLEYSNFYCSLINVLTLKRCKYICTVHGIDGIFINDEHFKNDVIDKLRWKYIISIKYIQNILFKFCDVIIAVSQNTKSFLINRRNINPDKIKVIYHGLSDFKKNISVNKRNELMNKYKIAQDDFVIGYVGRLGYAKGLESLISVFHYLSKINSCFKLILVGDGERRDILTKMIADLSLEDKCFITGFVSDFDKYYHIFDLFVLPSKSEGIPVVLWEAMLNKTIVLCSDVGGMPEIINDGENGFLYPLENINQFKEKILYIYNNKKTLPVIRESAYNVIKTKFDFNKNVHLIINEFEKCLKKNFLSKYRV